MCGKWAVCGASKLVLSLASGPKRKSGAQRCPNIDLLTLCTREGFLGSLEVDALFHRVRVPIARRKNLIPLA